MALRRLALSERSYVLRVKEATIRLINEVAAHGFAAAIPPRLGDAPITRASDLTTRSDVEGS
jgi:hypothetical protein